MLYVGITGDGARGGILELSVVVAVVVVFVAALASLIGEETGLTICE